mgnify:CR=1 FL=1
MTDEQMNSIAKLAKKIERAKTEAEKNRLFLSVYGEDREQLLRHIVLSMPRGTYLLKREGFASPSLERAITDKYGTYAGTSNLEKAVRGLSATDPDRVSANLTLGLDEVRIGARDRGVNIRTVPDHERKEKPRFGIHRKQVRSRGSDLGGDIVRDRRGRHLRL